MLLYIHYQLFLIRQRNHSSIIYFLNYQFQTITIIKGKIVVTKNNSNKFSLLSPDVKNAYIELLNSSAWYILPSRRYKLDFRIELKLNSGKLVVDVIGRIQVEMSAQKRMSL
ncbi:MAG: hypothetical protein A2381_19695 [Bdellovibrionales bacterium RIFOXYB1_FULL_37_110]|nr:MAG: hypothetical protein A2181_06640 [Bdellovibrionales bacterium RIFOXYA1_FULL_38_20]OFZ45479.1 MAG: hypothetical protein A2417_18120 [Bdellovibrionales bacterium RIFOXYC1_FULL_37_79]OFZ61007.1 MAG: hypothetical protein A2381_19695 [Bdellovibrionales bacterium RIFOXYB1_FULL_37_110]OFZ63458.1 MAG: hypothetical protein A2577_06215 [Bdellovibrionales bacterium RIFOXYD1_FULL_36_51]